MTKADRLKIYEDFFHKINLQCVCMNNERVGDAIHLIDSWSYAHRQGNGTLSDKQQKKMVEAVITKMKEF